MIGPALPLALAPPGDAVTVYETIAAPFEAGTAKLTTAFPSPATAARPVGDPGTPAGVTAFEAADDPPVPTELVAATVNV